MSLFLEKQVNFALKFTEEAEKKQKFTVISATIILNGNNCKYLFLFENLANLINKQAANPLI
jgi:hypothetical protein